MITIRKPYEQHDPAQYATVVVGESVTKQAFKDECDVNNIMAKYQETGLLEHVNKYEGVYGEMDGNTYLDYMNRIAEAKSMFEELPSQARAFFENDPARFLDYVNDVDEEKATVLEELGLAVRTESRIDDPTPERAEPAPPVAEPEGAPE